jgi:hypothetical protein
MIMQEMWKDFSDFEIAELAFQYGLGDNLELAFNERFQLVNRAQVEEMLTAVEMNTAFGE